jgi:hypothetical protein
MAANSNSYCGGGAMSARKLEVRRLADASAPEPNVAGARRVLPP